MSNINEVFQNFVENTVSLNASRIKRIEDAQRILGEFIGNQEDLKDLLMDVIPQGSFRQGTIIKPVGDQGAFDVDLLIKLEDNSDWGAADYHSHLAEIFKDSDRYEDLTDIRGKTRCVTIDYEGEFHVDLVPALERDGKNYVCNKTTDEFEETDGDGYAQWFEQRNADSGEYLVPVVKLLKYLRDSKEEYETKSIILTTIAGTQIGSSETFSSIPEALSIVLRRMSDYLSEFDTAPTISNPAMPGEDFDRHWKNDGKGFNDLKTAIAKYADMAEEALLESDFDKALEKWQALLGEKFTVGEDGKSNSPSSNTTVASTTRSFTPPNPYAE